MFPIFLHEMKLLKANSLQGGSRDVLPFVPCEFCASFGILVGMLKAPPYYQMQHYAKFTWYKFYSTN